MTPSQSKNIALSALLLLCMCSRTTKEEKKDDRVKCPPAKVVLSGPLVVKSGTTITLRAGLTYQYSAILIHKGGVLEFTGDTPEWTILRSEGNFLVAGTIRSRGFELEKVDSTNAQQLGLDSVLARVKPKKIDSAYQAHIKTKEIQKIRDINFQFKYQTDVQELNTLKLFHNYGGYKKGGTGGTGGRLNECTPGSCIKLSCNLGCTGIIAKGGLGGKGMSAEQKDACNKKGSSKDCGFCYLSATQRNISKEDSLCSLPLDPIDAESCGCKNSQKPEKNFKGCTCGWGVGKGLSPGLGGKGGQAGKFGGLLYLATCSNFEGLGGTVDVSGGTGEKGEDGQSDRYSGGGGGGGGPGGNGGKVYFNISGNFSPPMIKNDGGPGGIGGKGGVPHARDGIPSMKGKSGDTGEKGKKGATQICQDNCFDLTQSSSN